MTPLDKANHNYQQPNSNKQAEIRDKASLREQIVTKLLQIGGQLICGYENCEDCNYAIKEAGKQADEMLPIIDQYTSALQTEARQDEIHKFLNRSDSLGEAKYATRRLEEIATLKAERKSDG